MGKRIAYLRVSTEDQNLDRQLAWAKSERVDKIIQEKTSAAYGEMPELEALLQRLESGDVLFVDGLDRLSRKGVIDGISLVKEINQRGIEIRTANGFTFKEGNPMSELLAILLSWFANYEHVERKRRQLAGIEAAKKKGVYKGRKPKYTKAQALSVIKMVEEENFPIASACKELNVNRSTFYRLKRKYDLEYFSKNT